MSSNLQSEWEESESALKPFYNDNNNNNLKLGRGQKILQKMYCLRMAWRLLQWGIPGVSNSTSNR